MLTIRTIVLTVLAALTVQAQQVASNNLTTVDYAATTFVASPYVFGGHNIDWSDPGIAAATVATYGIRTTRHFLGINDTVPTTTLSAYRAALAAGCISGSVCDPDTWNWTIKHTASAISASRAQGNKILLCILGVPTWDSDNGTINGVPTDFVVWNDMVAKAYEHWTPDYVEILNEPDDGLDITGSPYEDKQTAYFHIYQQSASAIRSVSPTVPIGGPVICCSAPASWIPRFLKTDIISAGLINFVSYHNYEKSNNELLNGDSVPGLVAQNKPGTPVFVTEWNADSPCAGETLNGGDSNAATVPFWGMRLVNMLNAGITNAYYWSLYPDTSCSYYANGAINLKARVMELMSVVLGMGAGSSSVKNSSNSGATASLGAINSAGQHLVVIVNDSSAPLLQVVSLNNTGFTTDRTWNTFIASPLKDPATPIETVTVTPSGGSLTHTIHLPANSVAGVLVQ